MSERPLRHAIDDHAARAQVAPGRGSSMPPHPDNAPRFLVKRARHFKKSPPFGLANPQVASWTLRTARGWAIEGLVMLRSAAVTLAILSTCDFVAFGGRYTETVMKVLSAIERSFV
jgi:hypothetical protein